MKQKKLALLLAAPVTALALDGIDFEHGDWQIVCDNSGTCRAAGYQSDEGDDPPVSVQFTRKAGENEAVQGAISLLDASAESAPAQVEMHIDGKKIANITLQDDGSANLDPAQTEALLAAVQKKDSSITFRENAKKPEWRLSTVGANAVLLKMDDFQERVDTASALIKRGNNENAVLAPAALPVIKAVTPPQDAPRELKKNGWCPKKYAASNAPVIDIEKTDGKCLNVIEHLLGKTAGFTHCAAHPLAQTAVISLNADGISLPHLMLIILKGLKKRHPVVRSNSVISNAQCFQALF